MADQIEYHTKQSPSKTMPGPQLSRLFLLIEERTEYLWLKHLLETQAPGKFQVTWCDDPTIAPAELQKKPADLILWDYQLSAGGTFVFLRMLKQYINTPIVAVGPEKSETTAQQLIAAGASDYLSKSELSKSEPSKAESDNSESDNSESDNNESRTTTLIRTLQRASSRNVAEREGRFREHMDSLTGIIDRDLFYDRLHQAVLRAERSKEQVGLLFINVDGFRRVNQSLGYRSGDLLIKLIGARLREVLRRSDTLARIAGDEFAVIMESSSEPFNTVNVAKKIQSAFSEEFLVAHRPLSLSASLGMANYPDSGTTAELLLRHANEAMFAAKRDHGTSYRFFNEEMNRELDAHLDLETEFRQALRSGKLELHYQPKVDVLSGDISGMEALIRWPHPEHGLLYPDSFIGAAEKSGMIVPMGYWVIEQVCEDLTRFQELGYRDLVCAVNLSFRQFYDRKLTETVFRIIYNADIETSHLEFELTESAMMYDKEHTKRCLNEMNHLGISFALDDFGTGYSSLSMLRKLPISTVKIDKSFIDHVTEPGDDAIIVRGIISLAHNLQLNVVAEGVENKEQLAFLKYHHCDQAQGYLFSPAVSFEKFCNLLAKNTPTQAYYSS